ncbi:Mor transcription activator family protein [Fundidesulfovibrio butyratiphilus]
MSGQAKSSYLEDVTPILGHETASRLVRALGGTTFPVPKRANAQGEVRYRMLAAVIGEEAADLLVYHFGGEDLYIPRGARAMQARRDAEINAAFVREIKSGRSSTDVVNGLAMKYKLSDRRIWNILKARTQPEAQCRLF